MCYNCGCFNPDDDMGSKDNITTSTIEKLASKWKCSSVEAKNKILNLIEKNEVQKTSLIDIFRNAAKSWGQTVEDAQRQTQELLRSELKQGKSRIT